MTTPTQADALWLIKSCITEENRRRIESVIAFIESKSSSCFDEDDLTKALKERDDAEEIADRLSDKISEFTGENYGEHSSANCPWNNALQADLSDKIILNREDVPEGLDEADLWKRNLYSYHEFNEKFGKAPMDVLLEAAALVAKAKVA